MSIIKKLFCCHKWNIHKKVVYSWDENRIVSGTHGWFKPVLEQHHVEETTEVLICSECGKIKIITY